MNKRAMRIASLILASMTIFSVLSIPGFAANTNNIGIIDDLEIDEIARGEEIAYCYRDYNGKPQYRIWSITFGVWKTDWIDC